MRSKTFVTSSAIVVFSNKEPVILQRCVALPPPGLNAFCLYLLGQPAPAILLALLQNVVLLRGPSRLWVFPGDSNFQKIYQFHLEVAQLICGEFWCCSPGRSRTVSCLVRFGKTDNLSHGYPLPIRQLPAALRLHLASESIMVWLALGFLHPFCLLSASFCNHRET